MSSKAQILEREETLIRAALEKVKAKKAGTNFRDFIKFTMPEYRFNFHHEYIISRLNAFANGEISRLIIYMPPRHGKSQLVSRHLPAYLFGLHPDHRLIATSYGSDLAKDMNADVQKIIQSEEYAAVFPGTRLNDKNVVTTDNPKKNSSRFDIVGRKGFYLCAGVGGPITGKGAEFMIIDDPVKNREEADSPTLIRKRWKWYTSTFRTRYEKHEKASGILITLTPWIDCGMDTRLLELKELGVGEDWEVIKFPAIAGNHLPDYDTRRPGEALWPEKLNLEEMSVIKAQSSQDWNALYMCNPTPDEGNLIKKTQFKQFEYNDAPLHFTVFVQNINGENDIHYCLIFTQDEGKITLINYIKELSSSIFIERLNSYLKEYHSNESIIYLTETQKTKTLCQVIANEINHDTDVVKVSPANFEGLVKSIDTYLEAGRVGLLGDDWKDFLKAACGFPNVTSVAEAICLAISVTKGILKDLAGTRYWNMWREELINPELKLNPDYNIHATFDENVNPCITQLLAHIKKIGDGHYRVSMVDEVAVDGVGLVRENCKIFKKRYPKKDINGTLYYYGDRSLLKKSSVTPITGFGQISGEYKEYLSSGSNRTHKAIIPVVLSTEFCNLLIAGEEVGGLTVEFEVSPQCKTLLKDLRYAKKDIDGTLDKRKKNGVEEYGHPSDALRYLLIKAFWRYWVRFAKIK